jgi:DNA-binding PadR family transcriptional regulator
MPKAKNFLTPAEYAVLGLVRRKPAYGYELQRQLSGKQGLGLVCPVEPAMVYAILKSLAGLELVDAEWDTSSYPPKAVHSVTLEGEEAFERWLRRPVGRMREVRQDFLIKLYFALAEDRALARDLIREQVDVCRAYAEEAERELIAVERQSFEAVALGSKLTAAQLTLAWLGDCGRNLGLEGPASRDI